MGQSSINGWFFYFHFVWSGSLNNTPRTSRFHTDWFSQFWWCKWTYFWRMIFHVWGMVLSSPAISRSWLAMPLDARCTSNTMGCHSLAINCCIPDFWTYQFVVLWALLCQSGFWCWFGLFRPGPCFDVRRNSLTWYTTSGKHSVANAAMVIAVFLLLARLRSKNQSVDGIDSWRGRSSFLRTAMDQLTCDISMKQHGII